MSGEHWRAEEDRWLLPTYEKFPIVLERGEGMWVWDSDARRYLDFYGGHAVSLLGHSPEPVARAVADQARTLLFYSNAAYHAARARAAKALAELCGEAGSRVFFCNSGSEANEAAMRVARLATGRTKIVATLGSFHGRTAGALAATGLEKYRKSAAGLGRDVVHVPFGDLAAADKALDPDAAGLLLEPVQSMSGALMPPPDYLHGLERLCRARGACLIFDEVQTGLGRLGAPSAAAAFGARPHLQTFAKGLGAGFPCGALLASRDSGFAVQRGDLGSTFGGGPLACAAIEATLAEISRRRLWENAARMEGVLRDKLRLPGVIEIRGKGLLLGIVLDRPAKPVRDSLLGLGVLTGTSEDLNTLRLLPPLIVGPEEAELLAGALRKALSDRGAAAGVSASAAAGE